MVISTLVAMISMKYVFIKRIVRNMKGNLWVRKKSQMNLVCSICRVVFGN